MKKLLIVLFISVIFLASLYAKHQDVQHWVFQKAFSSAAFEFFDGPVRLKSAYIDRNLKMHFQDIQATLKSDGGPAPIQIGGLRSETSILNYFSAQGTSFQFEGLKPQGSKNLGISGRAELRSSGGGHFRLDAKIEGLDLGEVEWMNPDNLRGSRGTFTGAITSDGKYTEDPHFQIVLASKDGLVQSKFFSALLPYLPALPTKDKMAKLAAKGAVVAFRDAAVRIQLSEPQKIKIFLHILIPDYNVILNINFEIHLEETVSFSQLAQTLGLLKVAA